jgi:RNA polymerase sigma factor (TIGR02999 family)
VWKKDLKPVAVEELMRTLRDATVGDPGAADQLLPLLYGELRRLAHSYMLRLADGQTLQTTALVHEAYIRLVGDIDPGWNGRGHFFAAAAQAMRQILVEQARRKAATKRGGGQVRLDMTAAEPEIEPPSDDVLALDEALTDLEQSDPRKARVVLLHHFAGLTLAEAAAALGVSVPTAEREWRCARTLLFARLREKS